jgi:uncharacterized protein
VNPLALFFALEGFMSRTLLPAVILMACFCARAQTAASPQPAQADAGAPQVDPAKEADIRHLLELTGAPSLAAQSMDQAEKSIKPLITNSLPPGDYRDKLVDLFFEKFRSRRDVGQLVALIVPIYDKYYTADEIKGLIKFYESPLGKKMASALPSILSESQQAGGKWGQELGRQSMMEVLAEHPDLRQALEQAKANQHP